MAANRENEMVIEEEDEEEEGGFEFHADVLERILSHVQLLDLVSASHVSKSWNDAVSSSLRRQNKRRPWLILHEQARRPPYAVTARAYDPRSDVWIGMRRAAAEYSNGGLKSSHSNFVYELSSSRFSFSSDPLNREWHHAGAPIVWRPDPVVARVGDSVVIAGGGCDFEDDPLAVEIYDLNTRSWRICDSMPGYIRDTAASSCLSIAVAAEKLVVADRESGRTYCFDPATKSWTGPFHLRTGESISSYNVGVTDNSLILIGLCRIGSTDRVKIWKIAGEDFECEEIGEMPPEYVEKLRSESSGKCWIKVRASGSIAYVYSDERDVAEVVACELVAGGRCEWWSVKIVAARERTAVYTCSEVGIEELERAGNGGFEFFR